MAWAWEIRRANDTYAFGLAAQPGQSQGRPAMSTGSQPKEQIAACPLCVLPRKPQRPIPSDAKHTTGHDHHDPRTHHSHTGMSSDLRIFRDGLLRAWWSCRSSRRPRYAWSLTSIMTSANQHLSRILRGLALAATTVGLACADGSQAAQQPTRDARLSGSVEACGDNLQKCARVPAVVTLLSVHARSRTVIGKQYAAKGQFSFLGPIRISP